MIHIVLDNNFVVAFAVLILPLCFFSFENTKLLQYFSMVVRNLAFIVMIILALHHIATGSPSSLPSRSNIKFFDLSQLTAVFGASIYSYMCHHSIPGIIAPIRNKNRYVGPEPLAIRL